MPRSSPGGGGGGGGWAHVELTDVQSLPSCRTYLSFSYPGQRKHPLLLALRRWGRVFAGDWYPQLDGIVPASVCYYTGDLLLSLICFFF